MRKFWELRSKQETTTSDGQRTRSTHNPRPPIKKEKKGESRRRRRRRRAKHNARQHTTTKPKPKIQQSRVLKKVLTQGKPNKKHPLNLNQNTQRLSDLHTTHLRAGVGVEQQIQHTQIHG
jgi:hypothetical protein